MKKWIIVDVESDGPCPGLFNMVSVGAVVLDRKLDKTFYGRFSPLTAHYQIEALDVNKITRAEHLTYPHPEKTIKEFYNWVVEVCGNEASPIFVSDNIAFDWQWVNYYFHMIVGDNPFGFSGRRIGDLFGGMKMDVKTGWKHLRKTVHSHHPVDDARGNAEALLAMIDMGLKITGVE